MEITVISAQGLKNSSLFSLPCRLRPFITITTFPATSFNGDKNGHVYTTRVDDQGGANPTWGDKFYVPVDASFLSNTYSCICLELYTKRLMMGKILLGWCQIPVTDFGFPTQEGSIRYLKYRLRSRDGTRGHGIVNVAIKLTGSQQVVCERLVDSHHCRREHQHQQMNSNSETVIGIPITGLSPSNFC